jgi:hypothetical protein
MTHRQNVKANILANLPPFAKIFVDVMQWQLGREGMLDE